MMRFNESHEFLALFSGAAVVVPKRRFTHMG